jgi:trigger factor
MRFSVEEKKTTDESQYIELKSDTLSVRYMKGLGCKVHLEIKVEPPIVQGTYEKALHNVKKEVSIPGFRKGKVPNDMVVKNFHPQLEREWKDLTTKAAFNDALELIKLRPISSSSIRRLQVKKCTKEEGAEISVEFECEPEIPTIDIATLEFKRISARPITPDDVNWEMKRQLVRYATFEEVTDRPVQEGDFVNIDLDVVEMPAHNIFTGRLFHVLKEEMPSWVFDLIIGMNLNESREGKASPDSLDEKRSFIPELEQSQEKMEPKQCRITVTSIKKAQLPLPDDAFASKFGCSTLAELKDKIRNVLERDAKSLAQDMTRSFLAQELLKKYALDLPESLLLSEANARFAYLKSVLNYKEGALPSNVSQERDTAIRNETFYIARNFLTTMYLVNPIAEKMQISATNDELIQEIAYESTQVPPEHKIIFPNMDPKDARSRLFLRIMMRKALDHIIEEKAKA